MLTLPLCGCGKSVTHYTHCFECRKRISDNFQKLCETLRSRHRGAGGAAMCICGAGCGGTAECSALSMLKIAITTNDPWLRYSIADAVGWSSWVDDPLTIEKRKDK